MPDFQNTPAKAASLAPDSQQRLENAVQQIISLKSTQANISEQQAAQNAARLLERLCLPPKVSASSGEAPDLRLHLDKLKKQLGSILAKQETEKP